MTLRCPICGNRIARLADPCLRCAQQWPDREQTAAARSRSADPGPTALTLPAELRVPSPATASGAGRAEPPAGAVRAVETPPAAPPPGPLPPGPAPGVTAHPSQPRAATPEPAALTSVIPGLALRERHPNGRQAAAGAAVLLLGLAVFALRPSAPVESIPARDSLSAQERLIDASDAAARPAAALPEAAPAQSLAAAPIPVADSTETQRPPPRPRAASSPVVSQPAPVATLEPAPPAVAVTAPAAVVEAPPEPVVPAGPADPREACGDRKYLARALCINERCAKPGFEGHAECTRLRRMADEAEAAQRQGG